MRKDKQIIIIPTVIILGVFILLYFVGMFTNKQISGIPNKNEIAFVEIYGDCIDDINKYHLVEGDKDIAQIYDVLMSGKRNNTMESVNETPNHVSGKLTKIILTDSSKNATSLFVYQANYGKYYIEKPYEGIYEISVEEYEILTQYFIPNINID